MPGAQSQRERLSPTSSAADGGTGPLQPGRRIGDVAFLVHLKTIFNEMKGAYGWRRIWRELRRVAFIWQRARAKVDEGPWPSCPWKA